MAIFNVGLPKPTVPRNCHLTLAHIFRHSFRNAIVLHCQKTSDWRTIFLNLLQKQVETVILYQFKKV